MKTQLRRILGSGGVLLALLVTAYLLSSGQSRGSDKYVCSETNPTSVCNAANRCGSSSNPCVVDLKRKDGSSASVTPGTKSAKDNAPFCVKTGTTITWKSTSKDTGFVLDFGPSSPFGSSGAIIGGSDRPITVVAKRPGCYKFSLGACTSGTVYGMCGSVDTEMVVSD
jgi:hypothetical protein